MAVRIAAPAAVILLLVSLAACTGNNPNLAAYRDGLHDLDEKIYADYLAYVSEAEGKQTRSPDVVWANRRAVAEAEQYYNDGAKLLQGPATRP